MSLWWGAFAAWCFFLILTLIWAYIIGGLFL